MGLISKYKYTEGLIFNSESQVFVFMLNATLLTFNDISKSRSKSEFRDLLRDYTKTDSSILFKKLNIFSKNKKLVIDEYLNFINSLGFGFLNLIKFSNNKIIFVQKKIHLSSIYKNLFGEEPLCFLEEINAGFLENFLSLLFGKKIEVNIVKKNNSLIYECDFTNEDFFYETDRTYNYSKYKNNVTTPWISNLILQKKVLCESGVFGVMGKFGIALPCFFLFKFSF